ncbi:MAG: hypothetical protein ABI397_02165 [Candidatus Saccharimonas sp.]
MVRDNLPPLDSNPGRNSSLTSRKRGVGLWRKPIWRVVIVCVLVLIAAAVILVLRETSGKDSSKTDDKSKTIDAKTNAIETAQNQSMLGDYNKAAQTLNEQIAKTDGSDKGALSDLYAQEALVYYNNSQFDKALESAKQAENAQPTAATAGLVADSSHKLGDDKTALDFYHKQLDRLNADTTLGSSDMSTKDVVQKIEQLGGSV